MDQERLNTEGAPPVPDGVGPDWAMFIQQQISERATPPLSTPLHGGETAESTSNMYRGEYHCGK